MYYAVVKSESVFKTIFSELKQEDLCKWLKIMYVSHDRNKKWIWV